MNVCDLVGHAKGMEGKTSDEIKAALNGMSGLARLTGQGDDLRALQNMIQKDFRGDARAAVDFVKQYGNDPAISNQRLGPFVNSGAASQYVQQKLGQQPSLASTPAPTQPVPPPATAVSQVQNVSQIVPNMGIPDLGAMASSLASWSSPKTAGAEIMAQVATAPVSAPLSVPKPSLV